MSVQNLGTVFGPNILRPKIEDPVAIMVGEWHTFRFLPTLHKATQLHTVTHTTLVFDADALLRLHVYGSTF